MPATQSTDPNDTIQARQGELDDVEREPERVPLTLATLEALTDPEPHWVPTPEFGPGCGVFVPALTATQRAGWEQENVTTTKTVVDGEIKIKSEVNQKDMNERLVYRFAVNADGSRLFAGVDEEAALTLLRERSARAINRIADRICKLAGWGVSDLGDIAGN